MKCSIDGCCREALKRELCEAHYCKFRRNGTLKCKPIAKKGAPNKWLQEHKDWSGDDCLVWPFFRDKDGVGRISQSGLKGYAAKAMCIVAHGAAPFDEAHAAHLCGKAHEGCVNPKHLYWATSKENNHDRRKHGTMPQGERSGTSNLTEEMVRKIHADPRPTVLIARELGVGAGAIDAVRSGRSWSWLTGGPAKSQEGPETVRERDASGRFVAIDANGWGAEHPK